MGRFGNNPMFPVSFKEYVLVVADDNAVARKLYADMHSRYDVKFQYAFAFMYSEEQWKIGNMSEKLYKCKEPIEILVHN